MSPTIRKPCPVCHETSASFTVATRDCDFRFGDFLAERCIRDPQARTPIGDL